MKLQFKTKNNDFIEALEHLHLAETVKLEFHLEEAQFQVSSLLGKITEYTEAQKMGHQAWGDYGRLARLRFAKRELGRYCEKLSKELAARKATEEKSDRYFVMLALERLSKKMFDELKEEVERRIASER